MKACVLERIGVIKYKEVVEPKVDEGEVLVQVKACGICSSDIPRIFVSGAYRHPLIPGHEFSGKVIAVGANVSADILNRNVVVFPLIPCKECSECKKEQYARCKKYSYLGSRCDGGMSEYVSVPLWNVIPFSENVDYKVAAMCEPAAVALHAVERGGVVADDRVVIVGSGTIALLTAFWCRDIGVKEIAIVCRNEEKIRFVQELGFQGIYEKQCFDGMATKVFECVGTSETIATALEVTERGGELVLVGNPNGDINIRQNIYWKILRKELHVIGTWNSEYSSKNNNWKQVVQKMEEGRIPFERLVTDVYKLDNIQEALKKMQSNTFSIKTMLEI